MAGVEVQSAATAAVQQKPGKVQICLFARNAVQLHQPHFGNLVAGIDFALAGTKRAGDLGGDGLTEAHIIGSNLRVGAPNVEQYGSTLGPPNTAPPVPVIEIPSFRAAASGLDSWIKPGDRALTFRTTGQKKDVTLVPLNSLFDRRYSVYWQVS